jgi:cell division septation protein DedD
MNLPVDAYRSHLQLETTAIAEHSRDLAEFVPILYSDRFEPETVLIRSTNVHMVPGESSPRLRKVDLSHPRVPAPHDIETAVVESCTEQLVDKQPEASDNDATNLAETVASICRKIDNEPQFALAPFKTLGVLGMFVTSEMKPFVRSYIGTTFLLEMAGRVPDGAVADTQSEDAASEARGQIAVAALAMLLLPSELTHPRIQAVLFE